MVWLLLLTVIAYLFSTGIGTGLLWLGTLYTLLKTKGSWKVKMLNAIAYTAPFYYFSFFASNDRFSLCTLLSIVFILVLLLEYFSKKSVITKKALYYIVLWGVFIVGYVISVMGSISPTTTLIESYQIVVLASLIVVVSLQDKNLMSEVEISGAFRVFIGGTLALAVGVFFQYFMYIYRGVELGYIFRYSSRTIFNLFFYAKSVLSLYLSIGILFYYIRFYKNKEYFALAKIAVILGAIVINNSRTGLVCVLIVVAIYIIKHFKEALTNIRFISIGFIFVIAAISIVQYMVASRAGLTNLLDDNGRNDLIINAIQMLPQYIFSGIGGSGIDYTSSSLGMVVHNFAIAYMVQFGCIAGAAINLVLLSVIWKFRSEWTYYLLVIILGGMMFANWQNCTFIFPIYMFCMLKANQEDYDGKRLEKYS